MAELHCCRFTMCSHPGKSQAQLWSISCHTHRHTHVHKYTRAHTSPPPPPPPSNALVLTTRFIERKCIITALPFAPHKAAHIKRCLSLMFQQVISGITAKPCSCYLALSVEIIEIFAVRQHSHLNPAKKLVNSAFVFQPCTTLNQQCRRRGGTGSREKVKGAFWAGFLRKRSSCGGIVCACALCVSLQPALSRVLLSPACCTGRGDKEAAP